MHVGFDNILHAGEPIRRAFWSATISDNADAFALAWLVAVAIAVAMPLLFCTCSQASCLEFICMLLRNAATTVHQQHR